MIVIKKSLEIFVRVEQVDLEEALSDWAEKKFGQSRRLISFDFPLLGSSDILKVFYENINGDDNKERIENENVCVNFEREIRNSIGLSVSSYFRSHRMSSSCQAGGAFLLTVPMQNEVIRRIENAII